MLDTSCSSMWAQTAEYVSSNGGSTSFMTTSPRPPSPIFFSAGLPSPSEVTTFCKRGRFLFYSTGYIYWALKEAIDPLKYLLSRLKLGKLTCTPSAPPPLPMHWFSSNYSLVVFAEISFNLPISWAITWTALLVTAERGVDPKMTSAERSAVTTHQSASNCWKCLTSSPVNVSHSWNGCEKITFTRGQR